MDKKDENSILINNMLDKSEEAFLMAIEIYNKPTIKYRLEGFSFFICNAWELLLKAKILNDGDSIYYDDKPNRTITLANCISHIFTNEKDSVRKNLEIINNLRNTATHFIIKELDSIYLPFMQANVFNFSQKLYDYFKRDITEKINVSFMTLVVNNDQLSDEKILSIYGQNIFERYLKMKNESEKIISEQPNEKLAIKIDMNVRIVKSKDEAKINFRIAKDGEEPIKIFKEIKDINSTHFYTQKKVRELVISRLKRKGIEIRLTQYDLQLICDKYNLKKEEKYYYHFDITNSWGCSQQLVDYIVELFTQSPNIVEEIKMESKTKKD